MENKVLLDFRMDIWHDLPVVVKKNVKFQPLWAHQEGAHSVGVETF